jgi:hypothetical protein
VTTGGQEERGVPIRVYTFCCKLSHLSLRSVKFQHMLATLLMSTNLKGGRRGRCGEEGGERERGWMVGQLKGGYRFQIITSRLWFSALYHYLIQHIQIRYQCHYNDSWLLSMVMIITFHQSDSHYCHRV